MRGLKRLLFCVPLILSMSAGALAQSGEEQALKEMFFAKSAAEVEAHLPEAVRKAALELSQSDRMAFESQLLIRNEFCRRAKCTTPSDGHALLVVKPEDGTDGPPAMEIRLKRRLSDGHDSVLLLEAVEGEKGEAQRGIVAIWMTLEDGVWRVTEVHPSEETVTFDDKFVTKMKHGGLAASEASAVGSMRTLNTASITYAATYPDTGFPSSLSVLGGEGGDPNHSGLIDSVLAAGEKSGYRFSYEKTSAETYAIVARPVVYGQTGTRSFFTDQSGVIRFTTEDRAATASDPPLQ